MEIIRGEQSLQEVTLMRMVGKEKIKEDCFSFPDVAETRCPIEVARGVALRRVAHHDT